MISFNEACDQVGYVRNVLAPTTIYKHFAYESGHAYGYDEVALHFNDLYNVCIEFAKAGE